MSAESAHKTLPVLTGGAWLQIGDESFVPEIRRAMALFGSTSPSYPIMISLDLARDWLENNADEFIRLSRRVKKTKKLCRSLGLILPEGECDPTRIAFDVQNFGFDGADVGELLRAHGIEPEYAGLGKIILIPSVMNTEEDLKDLIQLLLIYFQKPCRAVNRQSESTHFCRASAWHRAKLCSRSANI